MIVIGSSRDWMHYVAGTAEEILSTLSCVIFIVSALSFSYFN
ncbi:MAG: hypothetical protein ACI8XV_003349 [Arenicella sp.]|jgi:hypothetical protein